MRRPRKRCLNPQHLYFLMKRAPHPSRFVSIAFQHVPSRRPLCERIIHRDGKPKDAFASAKEVSGEIEGRRVKERPRVQANLERDSGWSDNYNKGLKSSDSLVQYAKKRFDVFPRTLFWGSKELKFLHCRHSRDAKVTPGEAPGPCNTRGHTPGSPGWPKCST